MLLWLRLGVGSSATGCNRRMFDGLVVLVVVLDGVAATTVSRERLLLVAVMVIDGYNIAVVCVQNSLRNNTMLVCCLFGTMSTW
jgi:hypothetical protein